MRYLAFTLSITALTLMTLPAVAQTTTSNGLFGNRTLGGSFQGGAGRSAGGGATGGSAPDAAGSNAGLLSGNERFVRGSRQPGEFVGSDTQDVQNPLSQLGGGGGTSPLAGLGQLLQATQPSIDNARSLVRPTYSVGFPIPRTNVPQLAQEATERITRRLDTNPSSPLRIVIANRVATLSGSVATAHDRRLAALLVGLEPGVSRVENRLTVVDSSDSNPAATPRSPQIPRPPQAGPER